MTCRQPWLSLLLLTLAGPGLASEDWQAIAAEFALRLPLQTSGANGVVQLSVPLSVYQASRQPRLADLRIYNEAGQALPYHLDLPAAAHSQEIREQAATLFPSPRASSDEGPRSTPAVELRLQADGSLHWRSEPGTGASTPGLVELIVDLGGSGEHERLSGLRFEPPAGSDDYRAVLRVDRSSDLRWWETVAQAPLDWLQGTDGSRLANDRIDLPPSHGRYLRLRWQNGNPRLFAAIHGRWLATTVAESEWLQWQLAPQAGRQPGDYRYLSSPAIEASSVELLLPQQNLVLPASLGRYLPYPATREQSSGGTRFQPWLQLTAWRLLVDGLERRSGPVRIAPQASAEWVLRADPELPAPELRLRWRPQRLIFTARGQRFLLAVGSDVQSLRQLPGAAAPLAQVAPGFAPHELNRLEQALIGPALGAAAERPRSEPSADPQQQQRWLLWAVLGLGVAVLAGISWQLFRQLGSGAAAQAARDDD